LIIKTTLPCLLQIRRNVAVLFVVTTTNDSVERIFSVFVAQNSFRITYLQETEMLYFLIKFVCN